jgi:hypothetical protein
MSRSFVSLFWAADHVRSLAQIRRTGEIVSHDGAPYHTASSTQLYLETAVPSFFTRDEWPVAPDANPAENALSEVQCGLADEAPGNVDALDEAFRLLFRQATTPEKLHHLFASMNERMRDVIKARGDWTDW